MNVRSLYSTAPEPYGASQARSERVPSRARPHLEKVTDSVILSRRARAVLDEMRSRPDLDLSIQSKMHAEHLNDERTFEVVGRLERGFYADAHVIYRVASHVGSALTYGP